MHQPYDFDELLLRMAELDSVDEILRQAEAVGRVADNPDFVHRVKKFLFFMQYRRRPHGVSESDFQNYRPVVDALIQKGQLEPEVLDVFN